MNLRTIAAAAALAMTAAPAAAKLMSWPDLLGRPLPQADRRIAYGADPAQIVDLWLPIGQGPFPTVLMIHGGCWQASIAKLTIMNYAADDLRRRGIAVWNIEYRGADQPGGGYPGTFLDAAAAADALATVGAGYPLKRDRIVAVGHSAGGHLALWLAGRHRLAAGSPLAKGTPLPLAGVVSLGGLPDLEATRALGDQSCGAASIDRLLGPATAARPDPYLETSVPTLLPLGVTQVLIHGAQDRIAPPSLGEAYVGAAEAKHDPARLVVVPDSGHAEEISPGTHAWERAVTEIGKLLEPS